MSRRTLQNLTVYEFDGINSKGRNTSMLLEEKRNQSALETARHIVDRTLLVLESKEGMAGLVKHAENIVTELNNSKKNHLYPPKDLQDFKKMPGYIKTFVKSSRDDFPLVKIKPQGDADAAFLRRQWTRTSPATSGPTLDTCSGGFVASDSGDLFLALDIMDHMVKSQNNDHIAMWHFHMFTSVVHELGHCLTGYLSGNPGLDTPYPVGAKGYDGESGFALELLIFEYILQMWAETSRAPNQPGVPYAWTSFREGNTGQRIFMKYVMEFMHGTRGIPLPFELDKNDTAKTKSQLRALCYELMSRVRTGASPVSRPGSSGFPGPAGSSSSNATVSTINLNPQRASTPPQAPRPRCDTGGTPPADQKSKPATATGTAAQKPKQQAQKPTQTLPIMPKKPTGQGSGAPRPSGPPAKPGAPKKKK